jgi:predicted nucleic acid-binding Zn ribbon protein
VHELRRGKQAVTGRARAKRAGKPTRLGEIVPQVLKRTGLSERVAQAGVVARWPELVGAQVARVAHAESISANGTLFVRVRTAAWRQELSLMTHDIIARLNAGRKQGRIERIHWLVE